MPGPPSLRTGIEITNNYQPVSWMRFDADLALTRARFTAPDTAQQELYELLSEFPQAQIGNAPGNFIPEAPWMVATAGITLGERTGWFSTLRWRYISSRPLTEDGVFQAPPLNTINGRVGYQFANGWRIQLDALNLLNTSSYNASYAYGALLPSDALFAKCFPASGAPTVPAAVCQNGFMDYSIHPLDPTAVRLTLAGPIDTIDIPKMAAEFKRALPTYQPPASNYDWTGFYVGAYVDNTWSKASASTVDNMSGRSSSFNTDASRWGGGVQLGFDYMLPSRILLGVAADISSGGTKTTTISDPSGISANQTTVFDSETIRGRFGYAADNVLFYATGGFAWSNAQFVRTQLTGALNSATAGTDEAVNKGLMGWIAGGGVAYAFAQNWNVFAEYRYTSFGSSSISLPFSQLTTASTTTVSTVEFGANYKFTSGGQLTGEPPAPYPARTPSPALVNKSPPAQYAYDWSGIYLGSDGGFGWEAAKGPLTDATGAPLTSYNYRVTGPLAGLFAGGNYQLNSVVLGAEADWQWSNLTGNNQILAPLGAAGAFPAGPFTISTKVKDYASVRGRLGFALERFLIFGTGGWSWGNPSTSYALTSQAPFVNNGASSTGWTVGLGVDYAFTDSVFGRIEYRYTSLGTSGFVSSATNSAAGPGRLPISDLRAGLAYKFAGR